MSITKREFGVYPRHLDTIAYPRQDYPFKDALRFFDDVICEAAKITKDFTDPQVVYNEIEAYHQSLLKLKRDLEKYTRAKNNGELPLAVTLSKYISIIYFEAPMIFDDTNSNFPSKDRFVSPHSNSYIESRFTYVYYIAKEMILKGTADEGDTNLIKEKLLELIRAFIDVCHPNVASDIISGMTDLGDIYPHEIITNLLESLTIRYGTLATSFGNNVKKDDAFVENPFTILANSSCVDIIGILKGTSNYIDTVFGNDIAYPKPLIKKMFTDMLLKSIGHDVYRSGDKKRRDLFIEVLRTVRQCVTDWIKADDKRTPTIPVFDIIDMPRFIDFVYRVGIDIGKIDEPIQKFDDEIEELTNKLKESDKNEDKNGCYVDNIKRDLEEAKARRFTYLENKSLIGFLLQEIVSNEKVVYQALDMDTIFSILINRPASEDNAMADVWHVVMSTFVKRDFRPNNVDSLNPFYIHYNEGDISSPEAFLLASLLAGCMHHQVPSYFACAPIYNLETFEITIRSVGDTISRTNEVINTEIFGTLYNMKYYIENYAFEKRIDPNTKDVSVDFETLNTKEKLTESEKQTCIDGFKKIYLDVCNTLNNIFGEKVVPPSCVFILNDDTKKLFEIIVKDISEFRDAEKTKFSTIIDSLDHFICNAYSALHELERNKTMFDYIIAQFGKINCNINGESDAIGSWNRVINADGEYPKNLWPYSQSYKYTETVKGEQNRVKSEEELDDTTMKDLTVDKILDDNYSVSTKKNRSRFTRYNPMD